MRLMVNERQFEQYLMSKGIEFSRREPAETRPPMDFSGYVITSSLHGSSGSHAGID